MKQFLKRDGQKLLAVGLIAVAFTYGGIQAVATAGTPAPKYCLALLDTLSINIDQIIQGGSTERVLIALEAHSRLSCDPEQLLTALRIRK